MRHRYGSILMAAVAFMALPARAQVAEDESAKFTAETIVRNLDNPWGLAIRAGREKAGPHELFIAESGAGRVIRVATDQPEQVHDAVTGFPVSKNSLLPDVRTGPVGLAMLTRTKLIVSSRESADGPQVLRVYVLPGDDAAVAAEGFDHLVKSARAADKASELWSIATTATAAYVTSASAQGENGVLRAVQEANRLETLRPFISSSAEGGMQAPAAMTISPANRPQFLVVSDQVHLNAERDCRLMFYTLNSPKLALELESGLHDITGLAYSLTGQLYAVDAAWNAPGQGGVYRLDDARIEGRPACRAVKIAAATRGISLAFAPDGTLYVTNLGGGPKQGSVQKITGSF